MSNEHPLAVSARRAGRIISGEDANDAWYELYSAGASLVSWLPSTPGPPEEVWQRLINALEGASPFARRPAIPLTPEPTKEET